MVFIYTFLIYVYGAAFRCRRRTVAQRLEHRFGSAGKIIRNFGGMAAVLAMPFKIYNIKNLQQLLDETFDWMVKPR